MATKRTIKHDRTIARNNLRNQAPVSPLAVTSRNPRVSPSGSSKLLRPERDENLKKEQFIKFFAIPVYFVYNFVVAFIAV